MLVILCAAMFLLLCFFVWQVGDLVAAGVVFIDSLFWHVWGVVGTDVVSAAVPRHEGVILLLLVLFLL